MTELVIHVGPAKTGSTTIQLMLKQSLTLLRDHGVDLALPPAYAAHHVLANHLAPRTDLGVGWFDGDPTEDPFPPLDRRMKRHLLTSEYLDRLDRRAIQRLIDWAHADAVSVIAYTREPVGWLWSSWQQSCKSPGWAEWPDYVRRMTSTDCFFTSRTLEAWDDLVIPARLHVVPLESTGHPFVSFCAELGITVEPEDVALGDLAHLNAGMDVAETLLTAALVQEVGADLASRSWFSVGDIPRGFVGRGCIDLVDRGRPMADLARAMEASWSPSQPALLDDESLALVSDYRHAWLADARRVALAFDGLTSASRERLEQAVDTYSRADAVEMLAGPFGSGFPRTGFVDAMPLPAEFYSVARVMAASIGLSWRALGSVSRG